VSTPRVGRVRATAFAKVTLALRVLGRRPDGFHELEALTVSVGQPHDTLEAVAVPHAGASLEVFGDDAMVPLDEENLAVRATQELLLSVGRAGHGVQLVLRKRIPSARGLGGGSADAAAALLAVRRLLEVDIDEPKLHELAAALGSDVPFCLTGGAAWMRGRGELLQPAPLPVGIPMLLALAPFPIATPLVYRTWDELGGPHSRRIVQAPRPVADVLPELVNDLEPAAEAVEPRLRPFRERLEDAVGRPALLAGSGSAYIVLADGPRGLPDLAQNLSLKIGAPVVASATVSRAVRVES
jgi:4-diphosphocytidyl-2-C-methyl-D-erythritol kinase